MATVWLVLVAIFAALLAVHRAPEPTAPAVPASPLEPLAMRATAGELPKTSEAIPVVFFEHDSAALTEAGRLWLRSLAAHLANMEKGAGLRLDILPPARRPDVTAARVAAVAALLGTLDADIGRLEIGTHEAGASARFGLILDRQGGAQ